MYSLQLENISDHDVDYSGFKCAVVFTPFVYIKTF